MGRACRRYLEEGGEGVWEVPRGRWGGRVGGRRWGGCVGGERWGGRVGGT